MKRGAQTLALITILLFSITLVVAEDSNQTTDDLVTCDAFWQGYELNKETNECELQSTSGCSNPFKYSTKEECEQRTPKDNDQGKNDPELETCRDKCKANFEDEKNRGQCIRKCKGRFKFKDEFEDEEIELIDGGTTPDSFWYFLDTMFDGFSDDIAVKEEKVAEIKAMIEKGDLESARKALKHYKEYAEELGKEIDPKDEEAAKRSSLAIEKALTQIEDKLSADDKKEFYDDILDNEEKITTAVEIASKIKDLCQSLSEIDPSEYYRICKTDDDAPKWQKELHKDLTDEQRKEARKFGDIMSKCFKTSGQDCKCEEIPFPEFADACSEAAPLATACDIDGNKAACEKLDNLQMPGLPDHLQDIFDELEDMNEDKYDMHMPRECVEAGVTDPKECGKIMIETGAPEECKQALLDSGCEREFECRKICDKIMMEKHAPECVEQGITDPRECEEFFRKNGPKDHRGPGGPMIDFNCKEIQDPMERLGCFDKASSQAKGFGGMDDNYVGNCMTDSDWRAKKDECRSMYGPSAGDEPIYGESGDGYECVIDAKCIDFSQGKMDFDEIKEMEKKCAQSCESKNMAWDFSYGDCICKSNNYDKEDDNTGSCNDCSAGCPDASRTDCVNGRCECYYNGDEFNEPQENHVVENTIDTPGNNEEDSQTVETTIASGGGDTSSSGGTDDDSGTNDISTDTDSGGDDGDSAPEGDNTITGNAFLDYYYN